MKKTLLVLALAAALVFVFAASAFAYNPSTAYIKWDASGVNSNGPHADYQDATTKCAVCHSVHVAPGAGGVGSGATEQVPFTVTDPNPQLLLRSNVANSCRYCHVDTSIGGVQLYGGGSAGIYGVWAGPGHSGWSSATCVGCHAVHGANTYQGANLAKILRLQPSSHGALVNPQADVLGGAGGNPDITPLFTNAAEAKTAVSSLKYEQQTVFCTSCHKNYDTSADATETGASYAGQRSHSMVAVVSSNFSAVNGGVAKTYNADGTFTSTTTKNSGVTGSVGQVASAASSSCRACHNTGGVNQTGVTFNSFPHYARGAAYYLTGGAAPDFTNAGSGPADGGETSADGNCLMCHQSGVPGGGVGGSF